MPQQRTPPHYPSHLVDALPSPSSQALWMLPHCPHASSVDTSTLSRRPWTPSLTVLSRPVTASPHLPQAPHGHLSPPVPHTPTDTPSPHFPGAHGHLLSHPSSLPVDTPLPTLSPGAHGHPLTVLLNAWTPSPTLSPCFGGHLSSLSLPHGLCDTSQYRPHVPWTPLLTGSLMPYGHLLPLFSHWERPHSLPDAPWMPSPHCPLMTPWTPPTLSPGAPTCGHLSSPVPLTPWTPSHHCPPRL